MTERNVGATHLARLGTRYPTLSLRERMGDPVRGGLRGALSRATCNPTQAFGVDGAPGWLSERRHPPGAKARLAYLAL
jgi:hypothetical protein